MNRQARPGLYILFKAVDAEGDIYIDAYNTNIPEGYQLLPYSHIAMIVKQLLVPPYETEFQYSIAWCPSRNQAQKMACKNWPRRNHGYVNNY
jgi:hypothetical protein